MKEKIYKTEGITLISLVVTIVILLILAAVSIAMLTGENGIIKQAQLAKKSTKQAEIEESLGIELQSKKVEATGNGQKLQKNDLLDGKYKIKDLEYVGGGVFEYKEHPIYISNNLNIYKETKKIKELNIGDIVEYVTTEDEYIATSEYTGIIEEQKFNIKNEFIKCVVIDKSEDGIIKIIPLKCNTILTLAGYLGAKGLEQVLDDISSLYFNDKYATSTGSIGANDAYEYDTQLIMNLYDMGYTETMGQFKSYWPDEKRKTSCK